MKAVSQGITELEAIIKFLEGKCHALELIHASQHSRNNNSSGVSKPTKHAYAATHSSCVLCRSNHPLYRCKQFRKASSQQRLNLIKHNQLCFNCHRTSQCKVEWRCKIIHCCHVSLSQFRRTIVMTATMNISHSRLEMNKITAASQV